MHLPTRVAPLTLAIVFLWQAPTTPGRAPLVSVRVSPEAPAIGEPITIELRVRAPVGTEVRFPGLPDSADAIEPLDPRALRDASTEDLLDRTAVYRMIAWDTGATTLRFGDITLSANGAHQAYRVTLPPIRVRSVLPADSTGRTPRPARAPLAIPGGWWRVWLALAVLAGLGALVWRAWRRRHRGPAPRDEDPARDAEAAFTHATALGLLEAGEPGRFALTYVGIMREYLAARFPQANLTRTSSEVAEALVGAEFPVLPERVLDLLLRAEPIAFARAPVSHQEAQAIATEAQRIVREVETALRARQHTGGRAGRRVAS